ncbi:hypothetical protein [Mycobacterium sp. E1747]|uniref:hypothetical protein n=1 Tax=Mycobacterium sp. E1747 TaxID=1834128 RepID=UPI0007FFA9CE|nr:hypothetical protein [Mycobacterium sp. E1747]OBH10952.1 hypothetical protein A5695_20840 [Mycobacterium sp. E1747]
MATPEAIQRWRSVLLDIEKLDGLPRGHEIRAQLGRPPASANWRDVNATPIYGMVQGSLTSLVHDLWSVDPPTDPALTAVLEPVRDTAMKFTPFKPLLPQWDQYIDTVRAARQAMESQQFGQPTVDEIIHEMLLSLKTSVLLSGTAVIGSWTVIATEIARRYASFAAPITLPLRFYDVASKEMVDHPSPTTLSLAAIKAIIDPVRDDAAELSQPPGMKQFAAQVIVDFYTDWEEHYRVQLATAHRCEKYDFQINYFGDLGKLRHDYVHNRGICSNSAHCETLNWFSTGDLMIPTPANYLQLLTEFPSDELRRRPSRVETGRAPVRGSANIPILREFEKVARDVHGSVGPALDEALADWTNKQRRGSSGDQHNASRT